MHDFRHRFAIRTLLGRYRDGIDAEPQLPVLSTYLGQTCVRGTYWYLSASPELMEAAALTTAIAGQNHANAWFIADTILVLGRAVAVDALAAAREPVAERLRPPVDHPLELARLLERQLGRVGALEDAIDIAGRAAPNVGDLEGIQNQEPASAGSWNG